MDDTERLLTDMVQTLGDDGKHMRVQQRIIDGLSFSAVFYQAVLFENTELMGNSALRHAQFLGDVINTFFFVYQGVQNLQAGRSSEYFK